MHVSPIENDNENLLQYDFSDCLPKKLSEHLKNLFENLRNDVLQRTDSLKMLSGILEIETFMQRLHVTVSSKIRNKLISIFQQEAEKPVDYCVICILLIVLETCGMRNFDHINDERDLFAQTLPDIKKRVFKKLRKHYQDSPLVSWSFCLILFYYKLMSRFFSAFVADDFSDEFKEYEDFVDNQTVPDTIRCLIFSFDGINFRSTNHLKIFIQVLCEKVNVLSFLSDSPYYLEDFECDDIVTWSVKNIQSDSKSSIVKYNEISEELRKSDHINIVDTLQSISSLNSNKQVWPLYLSVFHVSKPVLDSLKKYSIDLKSDKYALALLSCIKIWQKSINDSFIAEHPEAFNWIVTFSDITFEAVKSLTLAVIIFQSIHRKAVLSSPHWYITLITDILVGIINHLEIGNEDLFLFFMILEFLTEETEMVELDSVCSKLISSVGRTWSALRPSDPKTKVELAHSVKNAIEIILARVSDANGDGHKNLYKLRPSLLYIKRKHDTPVVRTNVYRALNQFILIPFVKACDKFSLTQSKMGLKPASANALLINLVKEVDDAPSSITSSRLVTPVNVISRIGIGYKFSKKSQIK